jgi:hypothetical protein
MPFYFRGHYNQTLLCYKKKKVEDALRARFDPLACVTHSLVDYVRIQGVATGLRKQITCKNGIGFPGNHNIFCSWIMKIN